MASVGATQHMEGAPGGQDTSTGTLGEVGQATASPVTSANPWKEHVVRLLPKAVVEGLSELGYDSPEAITSSVMQPSDLDNWIQMLLEMHPEWRGKIPQERWHLAPIAGKLRMVWEKCYEVVPFKSAHKAEQQEEHGNASIQEDANTGVLEDDDLDNRKHNEYEAQPNPTQRDQDKHQGIAKGAEGQDNQDKHSGPPRQKAKTGQPRNCHIWGATTGRNRGQQQHLPANHAIRHDGTLFHVPPPARRTHRTFDLGTHQT